jgi:hypothetical protein
MVAARPVAPTQPHLARLRVERQYRLIEELRLAAGRHATAEDLAAALRSTSEPSNATSPASATPASPSPPPAAPAAASASTSPHRRPGPPHPRRDRRPDRLRRLRRPDISATARSALTRLLEALQHPTPNRSFDP